MANPLIQPTQNAAAGHRPPASAGTMSNNARHSPVWDYEVDLWPGEGGSVQLAALIVISAVTLAAMRYAGFRAMVAVGGGGGG